MGVPSAEEMEGKVIVLAGPTAVGKSSVAKELCRILDAEIVIADSVQVYLCACLYMSEYVFVCVYMPLHMIMYACVGSLITPLF